MHLERCSGFYIFVIGFQLQRQTILITYTTILICPRFYILLKRVRFQPTMGTSLSYRASQTKFPNNLSHPKYGTDPRLASPRAPFSPFPKNSPIDSWTDRLPVLLEPPSFFFSLTGRFPRCGFHMFARTKGGSTTITEDGYLCR